MRKNQIYSKKKFSACMLANLRIAPALKSTTTEEGDGPTGERNKKCGGSPYFSKCGELTCEEE